VRVCLLQLGRQPPQLPATQALGHQHHSLAAAPPAPPPPTHTPLLALLQEETNERKNALEAYVYDLRSKLGDVLVPFVREVRRRLMRLAGSSCACEAASAAAPLGSNSGPLAAQLLLHAARARPWISLMRPSSSPPPQRGPTAALLRRLSLSPPPCPPPHTCAPAPLPRRRTRSR
jgi:hypothetical protein